MIFASALWSVVAFLPAQHRLIFQKTAPSNNGGDRRGPLCALTIGGDVGEHEELATRMRPAQRLRQRSRGAVGLEQRIIAVIGIGLQNAGEGLEVALDCSCRRSREA